MRRLACLMLLLAPIVMLAACDREGPFERAGERIDRSIDQITR